MQEGASTRSCCECGCTSSWLRERSDPKCRVSDDEAARMRHIAETDVAALNIALGLRFIVVGQKRLNIFEYLPQVEWLSRGTKGPGTMRRSKQEPFDVKSDLSMWKSAPSKPTDVQIVKGILDEMEGQPNQPKADRIIRVTGKRTPKRARSRQANVKPKPLRA